MANVSGGIVNMKVDKIPQGQNEAGTTEPRKENNYGRRMGNRAYAPLSKPWVILAALIGAILFGLFDRAHAVLLAPIGEAYLSLLKMCVFPILITALITSVGNLTGQKKFWRYFVRLLIVFLVFMAAVVLIALAAGTISRAGADLNREAQVTFGEILRGADQASARLSADKALPPNNLLAFIQSLIPDNIFHSLTIGFSLQVLFFSLLLGLSNAFLPPVEKNLIIVFAESLLSAFFRIIHWVLYVLPLGLFCLISSQIAVVDMALLRAMSGFVVVVYVACFCLIMLNSLIIWRATGKGFFQSLRFIKDPLLIGLGTQSTFVSIPAQLEGLAGMGCKPAVANMVAPIGAVVFRFGLALTYAAAAVYTTYLYEVPLSFTSMVLALLLCVGAAVATAGSATIAAIPIIATVLVPLGLPSEAIVVFLLVILPFVEPITQMTNVHTNMAATAWIARN